MMGNEPLITASTEFKVGYEIPAVRFKNWVAGIPDNATFSITHCPAGDAREPEENTIKATWEMESPTASFIRRQMGPHSRACGNIVHDHGVACARDCPSCHGGNPDLPRAVITNHD